MTNALDEFESQLKHQIERYQSKRYSNKKAFYGLAITQAVLAILVTIILGINVNVEFEGQMKNIALITSGLANVTALIYALFKPKDKLMLYTKAASELKAFQARFLISRKLNNINEDDVPKIFDEFQKILSNSNRTWQQVMKKKDGKSNPNK